MISDIFTSFIDPSRHSSTLSFDPYSEFSKTGRHDQSHIVPSTHSIIQVVIYTLFFSSTASLHRRELSPPSLSKQATASTASRLAFSPPHSALTNLMNNSSSSSFLLLSISLSLTAHFLFREYLSFFGAGPCF